MSDCEPLVEMMLDAPHKVLFDQGWLSRLSSIIRERAIYYAANETLLSPSGKTLQWTLDLRAILLDGEVLDIIAGSFWDEFENRLPFQICGLEVAAIPLVTAIVLKGRARSMRTSGIIVRKERKLYGRSEAFEGRLEDSPIVLVDDLMNSGESAEKVRVTLAEAGRSISECFVVIDFASRAGIAWRQRHNLAVRSVFKLTDFGLPPVRVGHAAPAPSNDFATAWVFRSTRPSYFYAVPKSTPALDDRTIYFGCDDGVFYALDLRTGKERWSFRLSQRTRKGIWSAPVLHRGMIFFGGYDGNVYCLDTANGEVIWRVSAADWIGSSPCLAPRLERLFIGLEHASHNAKGAIAALNLRDGTVIWEHPIQDYQHSSPIYHDGYVSVYAGANDGVFRSLNADTGACNWSIRVGGAIKAPASYDRGHDLVLFGAFDGTVNAASAKTGEQVLRIKTGGPVYSTPLAVGNRVWVASTDKQLHVFSLDGRPAITIPAGSKLFSSPRLIGGSIYFGTNAGMVFEYDPESLERTGAVQLPERITNALVFSRDSGLFYALSHSGQLYALRRSRSSATLLTHSYRCFRLVQTISNLSEIASEIARNRSLWPLSTGRQTKISVQRETNCIALRCAVHTNGVHINNTHASETTALAANFPAVMAFMYKFASEAQGNLSRAMIVRLQPRGRVYPHVDEGEYYRIRDRYHLVVSSLGGSTMISGGECVLMREGELWWFDNKALHESINPSEEWRTHIIFDILPYQRCASLT